MFGIPKRALIVLGLLVGVAILTGMTGGRLGGASGSDSSGGSGSVCTVTVDADVLNVRTAPGTDNPVVDKLTQDEQVEAARTVRDGFRKLGDQRWVADEFVRPVEGGNCG